MNIQEKSKIEYRSRINRVMDYIDIHLDQPLELKSIAEIANFSPFHFHRIFTFLHRLITSNASGLRKQPAGYGKIWIFLSVRLPIVAVFAQYPFLAVYLKSFSV